MANVNIEFGVLLHTAHLIGDGVPSPDFGDIWRTAAQLEALGYDHVWVGDTSRVEPSWPRADAATVMTGIAMATQRLRIGVVPLSVPLWNPVLLAHIFATADVISGGRLIVAPSIGRSGPLGVQESAALGAPYNQRAGRFTEGLEVLRRLWLGETVTYEGRYFQADAVSIYPKPLQRPIPIYVAANGHEAGLRRAARFGDGWFTTAKTAEQFADHRGRIDAIAREAGRPDGIKHCALYATFHLDANGDKARADAQRYLKEYFGDHPPRTTNFFGSPDELAEQLAAYVRHGLDTFAIRFLSPDHEQQAALVLGELKPRLEAIAAHG